MPRASSHLRLTSEAHAFPISTEAAFRLRLTSLSRPASGVLGEQATSRLAGALEDKLRPSTSGMSLEVLRQLRDAAWFPTKLGEAPPLSIPLDEHLTSLAARYLEHAGHRVRLRGDHESDPVRCATAFRWLSFYLPADLLVSALAAREDREPPDDAVLLVTPRLAEVLREPCAETHLHVGAGVPFSLLWTALLRDIATGPAFKLKADFGAPPFGSPEAFFAMVRTAATVRLLLASFLWRREETGGPSTFQGLLQTWLAETAKRLPWGLGEHAARQALAHALDHLWDADKTPPAGHARHLYQVLLGPAPHSKPDSLEHVIENDPLSAWLPRRQGLALPEARFTTRALRHLANGGRGDSLFAAFFWQYQRVRCLTHRFLVEEPGTAGLDWFTRHYARISPLRGTLSTLTYATALDVQSRDLCLASLEARTAPAEHWPEVRDEVRALATHAARYQPRPARARPEVGLVLHFIKERERERKPRQMHADPRQTAFGCRFGNWFHKRRQQAMAIEAALHHHPELLLVLRGADVANVELAIPTWPLVPLFERVREASREASARLARLRPTWEAAPMRVTVHVGEDYRRLVEGLRRIHEVIDFGIAHLGDRIGHGVALGEDPARWAEVASVVTQPAEERLDDLLWELERYQKGHLPVDAGRLEYVRAEAVRLGRTIYDDPELDADDVIEARRLRHNGAMLRHVGFPFVRERIFHRRPEQLFFRHLTEAGVFVRGQAPVEVKAEGHEVQMLAAAQRWLRGLLGRMEMTVESNPSSNLVIADYLSLEDHPAFRMQPISSGRAPDGASVLVSVNTDNPLTFASSLADEFAHLYFALLGQGVSADAALAWLARARDNGYRSRFTLRASANRKALSDVARRWPPAQG